MNDIFKIIDIKASIYAGFFWLLITLFFYGLYRILKKQKEEVLLESEKAASDKFNSLNQAELERIKKLETRYFALYGDSAQAKQFHKIVVELFKDITSEEKKQAIAEHLPWILTSEVNTLKELGIPDDIIEMARHAGVQRIVKSMESKGKS